MLIKTCNIKNLKKYKNKESYSNYFNREIKKGNLVRIKKGIYANPDTPAYEIASNIIFPSYISLFSALNYYQFTEQIPNTIQVICTKQIREIKFFNYLIKFIKVKPQWIFGIKRENNMFIATQEKLILDALKFQKEMGNFDEIIGLIKQAKIDTNNMVSYLNKSQEISLIKRTGYLLEKYKGIDIYSSFSKILKKDKNYIKINLSAKKKILNKKWRIFVE